MAVYETRIEVPTLYEGDADFLVETIRGRAYVEVVAVFKDVSRYDADEARDDLNGELASRGLPSLPPLKLRR